MLYACCIPVRGAARAVICDLQRGRVYPVPNSLYALFDGRGCLSPAAVQENIDDAAALQVLEEYIAFLVDEELAFFCTEAEIGHYPALQRQWLFPAVISNCIIDAVSEPAYINEHLLEQLAGLCCNYIQFRFFEPVSRQWLAALVQMIAGSQVKSVSLVVAADGNEGLDIWLQQLLRDQLKIHFIILHNCTADVAAACSRSDNGRYIETVTHKLSALHCGVVSPDDFSPNIPAFTEALAYNSCLNRKLSIDAMGYIRNCPSMPEVFGHVSDTRLEDAVAQPGFKKYWRLHKDQVTVCRDCEFRYICSDCRAYVEEPGNDQSKPLKCGYDPYTATWQDWSTSPLKQAAIGHYGLPGNRS